MASQLTVGTLQRHLRDLAGLLEDAGGSKHVVDGLHAIHAGLAPFAAVTLTDFATFLARADEYACTGKVPLVNKPARARNPAGATNSELVPVSPLLAGASRQLADLYEQARHTAPEQIRAKVDEMAGEFSVEELKHLAGAVKAQDAVKRLRSKKSIMEAIHKAVKVKKDIAERNDQ